MKPKMPCFAGFIPVIYEAHATDETQGKTEFMRLRHPWDRIASKFGRRPSSMNSVIREKGTPSIPRTNTLCFPRLDPEMMFNSILTWTFRYRIALRRLLYSRRMPRRASFQLILMRAFLQSVLYGVTNPEEVRGASPNLSNQTNRFARHEGTTALETLSVVVPALQAGPQPKRT